MSELKTFEIKLPESFGVKRGGGTCVVNTSKIIAQDNILAILIENELTNKIGDSVAGVKQALGEPFFVDGEAIPNDDLSDAQLKTMGEKASEMMARVRDNMYDGKWTVKRKGSGAADPHAAYATELDAIIISIYESKGEKRGKKDDRRTWFDSLESGDDKQAKLHADLIKTAKARTKAAADFAEMDIGL